MHLPPGAAAADGGPARGWLAARRLDPRPGRADPARVVLSTLDGARVSAAELEERTAAAAGRYAAAGLGAG